MSVAIAAVVGSAAVGLGSAYMNKRSSEKASKRAASAQERSTQRQIAFQREVFEQQREDLAPWREVGERSLKTLENGVRLNEYTPGTFDFDFKEDPGYQFRLKEGVNALDASAAARGRLRSGAQDQAIMEYGQDLASQEYGNAFNRAVQEYQMEAGRRGDKFNRLASLANVGQSATNQTVAAQGQMGQSVGNAITRSGQAQAQNFLRQGQARSSFYGDAAKTANQGIQNYLTYRSGGYATEPRNAPKNPATTTYRAG